MHKWLIGILTNRSLAIVTTLMAITAITVTWSAHSSDYTPEQQRYLDARKALDNNKSKSYKRLRSQLDDYPLAVYLDFHANINSILTHKGEKALKELAQFEATPLYNTARFRYLKRAGSRKQWQDFLVISPSRPNNIALQCYFYRAQLIQGNEEMAFKGAQALWLYGKSRPDECDPLFKAWEKAGYRSQELIWSRMLLSFNANQYSLLKYLSKKVTTHKTEAKKLLTVYKDPRSLRHTKKYKGSAKIYADIVDSGLRKLARKDLNQAVKLYVTYQKADRFSDYQGRKLSRYLIKRAIIKQEDKLKGFVDSMLPLLDSDDLIEARLRWALRENDFVSVNTFLPQLSDQKSANPRWLYWQSRIDRSDNNTDPTKLTHLSQLRNFYGFTAANELKANFTLEHQDTVSDGTLREKLHNDLGLSRVIELLAIDKIIDARSEWIQMLNRHGKAMQKEYATLALENQWHDLGVQASIQGKLWNDMTLRFPYAADTAFIRASKKQKVSIDELRSIARRESAFYPYATSGVGARGLMQLMPATAKETARKEGVKYKGRRSLYQAETNIRLGSAYYAGLLKQFNNNRVLATAAYNAGPHRVKRWLKQTEGKLDVMTFIESIPFTETREYVQAVLSYRVIYQVKQGKSPELFSAQELNFKY
ncbi:lytic transglycosylase, catalytic [Shewanella sediminis HAW-EB3]|uniref:Lytic transglycosylase, catalytic n=1 Tax=Shewanella sediminis (strain HAW-EB3) TaxID=425104 RepID=A8FUR5_SHESH|nr:transglycosylase SLT domain-containing protein [Shewanella sediminis]ABV36588.1 lytic transglycosylase, catalytic [Shewanella sediminis HAW-EB3]